MRPAHPAPFASAALAWLALLTGCARVPPPDAQEHDPRDACRRAFSACAPPASFGPETNVASLDVRKLVLVASRLDLGDLSASAAARLRKVATAGDGAVLLEIEAAMENTDAVLGKCGCDNVRAEIEKAGIRDIVASRLPSKALRSPATWAERIDAQLATLRGLAKRSAELAIAGDGDAGDQADAQARDADRELCEMVHGARRILSPDAFRSMLELVYARREAEAGGGSAELARRTLAQHARSSGCEARAEAATP